MLRRTYLGLEIRHAGLCSIALKRAGRRMALAGGQTLALSEGTLEPAVLEPNVKQPEQFVAAVQEVLRPLTRRENRIAVALPDAAGHLFLLDVETPFSKQQEGEEIVRWQLKDLLPPQLKKPAISYQVLEERESGSRRVLVSLIAKEVLTQYEELLAKAGFAPALIDFSSLNIYNAFRSRVDLGRDFLLISVEERQLTLLVFANLKLDFYRVKRITDDPEQVFQELNRTLTGYRNRHHAFNRFSVYLHSSWPQLETLQQAVAASFEQQVALLPSPLQQLLNAEQLTLSTPAASSMAACLGVAERMIQRMNR